MLLRHNLFRNKYEATALPTSTIMLVAAIVTESGNVAIGILSANVLVYGILWTPWDPPERHFLRHQKTASGKYGHAELQAANMVMPKVILHTMYL